MWDFFLNKWLLSFNYLAVCTLQAGLVLEKVVTINEEQLPVFQVVLLYKQAVPVKSFYYPDFLCRMTSIGKEGKYSKRQWASDVHCWG